jgi:hypothetical protein
MVLTIPTASPALRKATGVGGSLFRWGQGGGVLATTATAAIELARLATWSLVTRRQAACFLHLPSNLANNFCHCPFSFALSLSEFLKFGIYSLNDRCP